MKVCRDLTLFYEKNDKDITNILAKKFSNVIKYYPLEDLKSDLYLRLHKKNYVQNYRPFEISIDLDERTWHIKPTAAKFSTYICKFIFNYIYAYHNKINPNNLCVSLDMYNDSNYSEENNSKIHFDNEYNPIPNTELKMEIEKILSHLSKKTKEKGNIASDNEVAHDVMRLIDREGKKGCPRKDLVSELSSKYMNNRDSTNMEEALIMDAIQKIEKTGQIKRKNERYYLQNAERRSLYNLFRYYMKGYRDKEISEKFKMTVAGIGALKRSLRKEIQNLN